MFSFGLHSWILTFKYLDVILFVLMYVLQSPIFVSHFDNLKNSRSLWHQTLACKINTDQYTIYWRVIRTLWTYCMWEVSLSAWNFILKAWQKQYPHSRNNKFMLISWVANLFIFFTFSKLLEHLNFISLHDQSSGFSVWACQKKRSNRQRAKYSRAHTVGWCCKIPSVPCLYTDHHRKVYFNGSQTFQ